MSRIPPESELFLGGLGEKKTNYAFSEFFELPVIPVT